MCWVRWYNGHQEFSAYTVVICRRSEPKNTGTIEIKLDDFDKTVTTQKAIWLNGIIKKMIVIPIESSKWTTYKHNVLLYGQLPPSQTVLVGRIQNPIPLTVYGQV